MLLFGWDYRDFSTSTVKILAYKQLTYVHWEARPLQRQRRQPSPAQGALDGAARVRESEEGQPALEVLREDEAAPVGAQAQVEDWALRVGYDGGWV